VARHRRTHSRRRARRLTVIERIVYGPCDRGAAPQLNSHGLVRLMAALGFYLGAQRPVWLVIGPTRAGRLAMISHRPAPGIDRCLQRLLHVYGSGSPDIHVHPEGDAVADHEFVAYLVEG
jgi:hypothetical protein